MNKAEIIGATLILSLAAIGIFIITMALIEAPRYKTLRAKVLENNTITYIIINEQQHATLRPLDTVWLDLSTHTINDTSNYTMKAVILTP